MAHTDRTRRTPRPNRTVTFYDFQADGTVDTETYTQEYGRRAGLHTHRSQVSERRRRANRRDRHADRAALRRDPEAALSRPRSQAVWLAT